MTKQQWFDLMNRLSFDEHASEYELLVRAYSEKHRHYHTVRHISDCLSHLADFQHLTSRLEEVELALWFHDAVYNPMSKDNEMKSANWASEFLKGAGCDKAKSNRIHALIMATVHAVPAVDSDAQLLVDIDLSILGSDSGRYRDFEKNIRREYKWVPGPIFRKERKKILQSFLKRDAIYSHEDLGVRFETQARTNIEDAIRSF